MDESNAPDLTTTALPPEVIEAAEQRPLSKNAQKRLVKAAKRAEQRLERRAKERAAKKAKKRARAVALEDDPEPRPKKQRVSTKPFEARIVIDLGFDSLMTPKARECGSLCSQLGYTYSLQRRASVPFTTLLFTSLGGETKSHLEISLQGQYKRWKHVQWWEEGYEKIWAPLDGGNSENESEKSKVVYLTADSENEISELEPGCTYIIGGIVDHNRYKNLCLDKAQKQGIQTAKLPIGTYLAALKTRKVLTVNQCYDILLRWAETRDWEESIRHVMPTRKLKDGKLDEGVVEDANSAESAAENDDDLASLAPSAADEDDKREGETVDEKTE
ncbi:hypothetical protein DL93DRAFT_2059114 [Clavulina sp. PMI_390]|nr:hypothetical protein DL93DRAFT_2059114 [Clavulina sp. PMI_390]